MLTVTARSGLSGGDWQNREMTATRRTSETRRAGSLQPVELAQASVMAALCAATAIVAVVVPFAAGVSLLGTVPMGLLAYRYRLRVLVAATIAGATIAFLIAGMGGFMTVVNCAYIGGLTGIIKRRGRGTPTVLFAGLAAGVVFGIAAVAALTILARLRNLIFESMTANINGIAAESIEDLQVLPLQPRIRALQEAYVRKVVDAQDQPVEPSEAFRALRDGTPSDDASIEGRRAVHHFHVGQERDLPLRRECGPQPAHLCGREIADGHAEDL